MGQTIYNSGSNLPIAFGALSHVWKESIHNNVYRSGTLVYVWAGKFFFDEWENHLIRVSLGHLTNTWDNQ